MLLHTQFFGDISACSWDHEREKNTYSKPEGKRFEIKGDDADQGRSNESKKDPAGERNGSKDLSEVYKGLLSARLSRI